MRTGLATLALALLVFAGSAEAGTLAAGPMQGDTFLCNVVNLGPVTQSVRVDIVNSFNAEVLESETCDTVEPNTECLALLNTDTVRAFCRVTSSAAATHLRGNLVVVLGLSDFSFDLR